MGLRPARGVGFHVMKPTFISASPLPGHLVESAQMVGDAAGSFIVRGKRFDVLNARGTIAARQDLANRQGVICFVEQHLNASTSPTPWYSCAFYAENRHPKTTEFARLYVETCSRILLTPNGGHRVGPSNCARMYRVPAFLAEPGFISNPEFSRFVRTGGGAETVARCLVETIEKMFPNGGLVGLSVGHAYRGNNDPGAPAYTDEESEDPTYNDEAEIADGIVNLATELLVAIP